MFKQLQLKPCINTELSSLCDIEQFLMSNKTTPQHFSYKVFEELGLFLKLLFPVSAASLKPGIKDLTTILNFKRKLLIFFLQLLQSKCFSVYHYMMVSSVTVEAVLY